MSSILDAGCSVAEIPFLSGDARYWMLDTGYWMLDTGYWILDIWYSLRSLRLVEDPVLFAGSLAPSINISGYVNILGYLGSDCKCPIPAALVFHNRAWYGIDYWLLTIEYLCPAWRDSPHLIFWNHKCVGSSITLDHFSIYLFKSHHVCAWFTP